ncbi:hypothetical protein KO361_00270 [Candidatus Woesearchaeota archaeon]|nr:hypothetical protein [Candidatus Woesearchaeota archaeon]
MKKELITILLILVFFLVGCSNFNESENEALIKETEEENLNKKNETNFILSENCEFPRNILREEHELMEEIKNYDYDRALTMYLNSLNVSPISFDNLNNNINSPLKTYTYKNGTQIDILRLASVILVRNCYIPINIIYEHNAAFEIIIAFRYEHEDIAEPRYLYFDEKINTFRLIHYGWSFEKLFELESERKQINIERYGLINTNYFLSNLDIVLNNEIEWFEI